MDAVLTPTSAHALPRTESPRWFALSQMQAAYLIGRGDILPLGKVSSHVYHEFKLCDVDVPVLEQSLRRVVARHPALRAVISADGRQAVLDMARLPERLIAVHDTRGWPEAQIHELHTALRAEMSAQVAPLDRPCAVDARLLLLEGDRALLLVSHDGLQIDGISMQILFADWAQALARPEVMLPALPETYSAQVHAEQRLRQGPAWRLARTHWLTRLRAARPAPPRLPLACDPANIERGVTSRHEARLDTVSFERFERNATAAGVTTSTALFAAYAEVLQRWSGPGSITLNVTLANRLPVIEEVDDTIGNYTVAVLVAHDAEAATFADRARTAQTAMRDALEHRHFNALDVARELAAESSTPIEASIPYTFNCALGHRSSAGELLGVETLGDEVFGASQTPQVCMNAFALRSHGGLWLQIDAVQGLFAPGVPDAVASACQTLLQQLADSEAAWTEESFELLPVDQRRRRDDANATAENVPVELMHAGFLRQARLRPDAVALCTSTGTLSYGELLQEARSLAQALAAHRPRPDEPVAVVLHKGPHQIAALLAVSMAGAAYLPIDAAWPLARRCTLLANARVRVMLCESTLEDQGLEGLARIDVDCMETTAAVPTNEITTRPDHLAYVLYTSGSTGQPKGVMVSHHSVVNLITDINARYRVGPADRAFGISHFNFDLSVYDIFGLLAAGGAIVLPDHDKVADPGHWLALARTHGVTLWNSVPSIVQMLVDHCEATGLGLPETLRLVMMSGDRIPPALVAQLHSQGTRAELHSLGGPTETTVWNVCHPIGPLPREAAHVPYGKPTANNRYYVLDERLHDCPDWVVGELYAAGAGLARGYWDDERRTRDAFVVHPRSGERLYRTGDVGRYLPDGNLEIHGRGDFQVKVNGHRVELGEVEACLATHPCVRSCAVVGPHPGASQQGLVAFVVTDHATSTLDAGLRDSLKQHVAERLPRYMMPAHFVGLPRLPLSDNAKVDRKQLMAMQAAPPAPPAAASMSMLEEQLARLWSELLQQPAVSAHDNFFALGGDSMKAARLIVKLRKEFAVTASLAQVMHYPTVHELAGFIASLPSAAPPPPRRDPIRSFFRHPPSAENAMTTEAARADGTQGHGSLYGQGFLEFMADIHEHLGPAWQTAEHVMTHGGRLPLDMAVLSLGLTDQAAYEVLKQHQEVTVVASDGMTPAGPWLDMAVNAMGRLHLRPGGEPRVNAHTEDQWLSVGIVVLTGETERAVAHRLAQLQQSEIAAIEFIRRALARCESAGELDAIVEQVIDHVEHVESVCFYSEDRFFALIDRFTNLIDTKASTGFLPLVRGLPLAQWSQQQLLIVGALHALFISGKAVRFEEFNGSALNATRLIARLRELHKNYIGAGCDAAVEADGDVFELAEDVRRMAASFTGRSPLRYRWIYALTFQKNERLLPSVRSTEDSAAHIVEFADLYGKLMSGRADPMLPQSLLFTQLASACLARDLQSQPYTQPGSAATGWLEHLIERIVTSAMRATDSDYAMSSSLRDIGRLRLHDVTTLSAEIHALTPADFYTCFVSKDFATTLDEASAQAIASSVQKRMMFNRWHFIPGNLERGLVSKSRHWYYPPLVPDIAEHSDVHRAAHSRARVKFSIRAPGPDVSRPPLRVALQNYRGFYDIRVVRMDGPPYTPEDMLRARRRTLWLEAVYGVLVSYLEESPGNLWRIEGFAPGSYLDLRGDCVPVAVLADERSVVPA
jgi:pyochelin synthetase